jgi:hypothetical protein
LTEEKPRDVSELLTHGDLPAIGDRYSGLIQEPQVSSTTSIAYTSDNTVTVWLLYNVDVGTPAVESNTVTPTDCFMDNDHYNDLLTDFDNFINKLNIVL